MATTVATLPMEPHGGLFGLASTPMMELQADDANITKGDVVVFNGDDLTTNNDGTAEGVVGVALHAQATAGGLVQVALAYPGALFEGNLIDGAADEVGAADTYLGIKRNIKESADGYACVDFDSGAASSIDIVRTLRWGKQHTADTSSINHKADPYTSGVGVTNPRVIFCFVASVFMDS